jgi:hypothetical protein
MLPLCQLIQSSQYSGFSLSLWIEFFLIWNTKPDMCVHACNPNYSGGRGRRVTSSRPAQTWVMRPSLKDKIQTKGLGGPAQKHLSSMYKATGSFPSSTHKNNQIQRRKSVVSPCMTPGESGKHQSCPEESPQLLPKLVEKSPNSQKPRDTLCSDTIESNWLRAYFWLVGR